MRLAGPPRHPAPLSHCQPLTFVETAADIAAGERCTAREDYQAWLVPQWGQPTEVVTSALKLYPHWHRYRA